MDVSALGKNYPEWQEVTLVKIVFEMTVKGDLCGHGIFEEDKGTGSMEVSMIRIQGPWENAKSPRLG